MHSNGLFPPNHSYSIYICTPIYKTHQYIHLHRGGHFGDWSFLISLTFISHLNFHQPSPPAWPPPSRPSTNLHQPHAYHTKQHHHLRSPVTTKPNPTVAGHHLPVSTTTFGHLSLCKCFIKKEKKNLSGMGGVGKKMNLMDNGWKRAYDNLVEYVSTSLREFDEFTKEAKAMEDTIEVQREQIRELERQLAAQKSKDIDGENEQIAMTLKMKLQEARLVDLEACYKDEHILRKRYLNTIEGKTVCTLRERREKERERDIRELGIGLRDKCGLFLFLNFFFSRTMVQRMSTLL